MKLNACILIFLVTVNITAVLANDLSEQLVFSKEVDLLGKHYSPIVLSQDNRKIIVLKELQGRVMSGTALGDNHKGFGWFHYRYLSGEHCDKNAVMGGASRLWFGPDASKFSLFFESGSEPVPENIRVPESISTIPFDVVKQTDSEVVFKKELKLKNYQNTLFNFELQRDIALLDQSSVEKMLSITVPNQLNWLGYRARTKVKNIGNTSWQKQTGLFSIWELGAFYPTDHTTVIIPLVKPLTKATRYFSDIKESHTKIIGNTLFYKADANYMNKIGVPPEHTKPIMASYDDVRQLLTLVIFTMTSDKSATYVNGVWEFGDKPYGGEIINIFNDGPDESGVPFGPFYEMETSSIALMLSPQQSYQHQHTTIHFQGSELALNQITTQLLGQSITTIKSVF